jgi:hypothetical protein
MNFWISHVTFWVAIVAIGQVCGRRQKAGRKSCRSDWFRPCQALLPHPRLELGLELHRRGARYQAFRGGVPQLKKNTTWIILGDPINAPDQSGPDLMMPTPRFANTVQYGEYGIRVKQKGAKICQ